MNRKKKKEEYIYTFQIPFLLEVRDSYNKVLKLLKDYTIEDLDLFVNELDDNNINDTFLNKFKEHVIVNDGSIQDQFINFVKINYDTIDKFNVEHDTYYTVDEINNDGDVINIISDQFDNLELENFFDTFKLNYIELDDFDYKSSSFNVIVSVSFELEDDQVIMIVDYLEEQCIENWGKLLYEETRNDIAIVMCKNKNGKRSKVTLIGVLEPETSVDIYYDDYYDDYDF
jgi:hypothetical protein